MSSPKLSEICRSTSRAASAAEPPVRGGRRCRSGRTFARRRIRRRRRTAQLGIAMRFREPRLIPRKEAWRAMGGFYPPANLSARSTPIVRREHTAELQRRLRGGRHLLGKLVDVHPVASRGVTEQLEGQLERKAVPLSEDTLPADHDPRVECLRKARVLERSRFSSRTSVAGSKARDPESADND